MGLLRTAGILFAIYIVFVLLFESVYLGWLQPKLEGTGIPMLVLMTVDEIQETQTRRLARFETEGKLYVSAHHWTRGWYHKAVANPEVMVEIDDSKKLYRAVVVEGDEFDKVAAAHPIPFLARFLMGFPPKRDILRLDPSETSAP